MTLFLFATVAGRAIAIPSEQVDSVVDIGAIVPVPRADPAAAGLVALRSRVVTVIDTRIALGLPPAAEPSSRAVITALDGHHYAILVDGVDDVVPLERQPLTAGVVPADGWARCAAGLAERDGVPLLVVDLAALVPSPALAA